MAKVVPKARRAGRAPGGIGAGALARSGGGSNHVVDGVGSYALVAFLRTL